MKDIARKSKSDVKLNKYSYQFKEEASHKNPLVLYALVMAFFLKLFKAYCFHVTETFGHNLIIQNKDVANRHFCC